MEPYEAAAGGASGGAGGGGEGAGAGGTVDARAVEAALDLRVRRGHPDAAELAALTAVLTATLKAGRAGVGRPAARHAVWHRPRLGGPHRQARSWRQAGSWPG